MVFQNFEVTRISKYRNTIAQKKPLLVVDWIENWNGLFLNLKIIIGFKISNLFSFLNILVGISINSEFMSRGDYPSPSHGLMGWNNGPKICKNQKIEIVNDILAASPFLGTFPENYTFILESKNSKSIRYYFYSTLLLFSKLRNVCFI